MDNHSEQTIGDGENLHTSIEEDIVKENFPENVHQTNVPNRLTIMEKKFLLAVERGDLPAVKR